MHRRSCPGARSEQTFQFGKKQKNSSSAGNTDQSGFSNGSYTVLTVDVAECPKNDNKNQNCGDASSTKLPRCRACEYSSKWSLHLHPPWVISRHNLKLHEGFGKISAKSVLSEAAL